MNSDTIEEGVSFRSKKIEEWTSEDVEEWMMSNNFTEEANLFKDGEITGRALAEVDKEVLKEIGVKVIGRRLEIMNKIKGVFDQQTSQGAEQPSTSFAPSKSEKDWNVGKITQTDKNSWKPEIRALYNTKTAMIIREAAKVWKGNMKVYFKHNETNKLKLEELTTQLKETCSIPEVGYGYAAIRAHLIQWAQEKNRKITDGYDYEAEHTPAKRARKTPSCESSDADVDHDTDCVEGDEDPSSNLLQEMSSFSAKIAVLVAFKKNCLEDLTLRGHLVPLAKFFKLKHRSMGKYELVLPLAKQLFEKGYLRAKSSSNINFRHLKRSSIKVIKSVQESLNQSASSSSTDHESENPWSPPISPHLDDCSASPKSISPLSSPNSSPDRQNTQA